VWKHFSVLGSLRIVAVFGLVGGAMYAAYDGTTYRTPSATPPPVPVAPHARESAPMPKDATPRATAVSTPNDAVRWAWADAQGIPPNERCFFRYVWIRDGLKASRRTVSIAVNYSGSGKAPVMPPMVLFGGHLARLDLRHYWPTYEDYKEVVCIWEEFRYDPSFSRLITKDTLELLLRFGGLRRDEYERRKKELADIDVLRFNSPAIDADVFCKLQEALHTEAPVVESLYYDARSLTTIQDKGAWKVVWSGKYNQLRGIRKAADVLGKDTKVTDLDFYFADRLGIGDKKNIRPGFAKELFDRLRSDARMATTKSEVTGSPREVFLIHTPSASVTMTTAMGAITGDVAEDDVSPGQRAYMNLDNPFRRAREGIFFTANGTRDFTMWKEEDGSRQDEVPFNIANDTTIPRPHRQRLQVIGCFRCHETDGSDGWKPVRNSVQNVLRQLKGPDVLTDLSGLEETGGDFIGVNSRLAQRYLGNFTKPFMRARDDTAEVRMRITGPITGEEDEKGKVFDQTQIVRQTGERLRDEYARYVYDMVDAKYALYTLGLDVPQEYAQRIMEVVLPPDVERSRVGDVVFEDARIAYPRSGEPVLPQDWWLSYSFAAERYRRNVARLALIGGPRWADRLMKGVP
jgi:hypothetical protein